MSPSTKRQADASIESSTDTAAHASKDALSYDVMSMSGGLVRLFDLLCILFAAWISTAVFVYRSSPPELALLGDNDFAHAAWVAAVLAPFILFDKRFGASTSRGEILHMSRSYGVRFAILTSVLMMLGTLCQVLDRYPLEWLATWFVSSLLLTLLARVLVALYLRRLQQRGVLTEVFAVVGAGPVADRLVRVLLQSRPAGIELLGVFDDKIIGAVPSAIKPVGNVAQLIELGKTRKIDWILLTLPPTAEHRLLSIVQRLKALSVPIGLCPQNVGLTVPYRVIDYVGESVPVSLLANRRMSRWEAAAKAAEDFLPRWLLTLGLLPVIAFEALANRPVTLNPSAPRRALAPIIKTAAKKFVLQFDNYDLAGFAEVAAGFGGDRFGYAVTPNADHVIRLHEDASFRALYADANYVLLDSRFLSHLLSVTKGVRLPVCTGSDLTAMLFSTVISPNDRVVLIGASAAQARQLRELYHLECLMHFNPPMGFIRDPDAVEACLSFIETHSPFRFCLLAVGAPQQETLAHQLKSRGIARGLALCIGASINFLTGDERRAPMWIQSCGMEWSYRLMQAPGRMATRYLVRGPRVFAMLNSAEILLRKNSTPTLRLVPPFEHTVPALSSSLSLAESSSGSLQVSSKLATPAKHEIPAVSASI